MSRYTKIGSDGEIQIVDQDALAYPTPDKQHIAREKTKINSAIKKIIRDLATISAKGSLLKKTALSLAGRDHRAFEYLLKTVDTVSGKLRDRVSGYTSILNKGLL